MKTFDAEGVSLVTFREPIDVDRGVSRKVLSGREYRGPVGWPGVEAGDVWLDCGGHIGAAAIWFLRSGAKAVVSVEPDPLNAQAYRKNLARHGRGSYLLLEGAVVGRPPESGGKLTLNLHGRNSASHRIRETPIRGRETVEVNAFSLSSVFRYGYHGQEFNAIKLDVEGCEVDCLEHFPNALFRGVRKFAMEYHFGPNPDMVTFLAIEARLARVFKYVETMPRLTEKDRAKKTWDVYPNMITVYAWRRG